MTLTLALIQDPCLAGLGQLQLVIAWYGRPGSPRLGGGPSEHPRGRPGVRPALPVSRPWTSLGTHAHARGRGVTVCSSPHRKWAAEHREEPTVAWRGVASRLALPSAWRAMARARAAKGLRLRLLLRSVALWLALLGARTATASKAVTAHLAAKWPETPLLLEARWVPRPGGASAAAGEWRRAEGPHPAASPRHPLRPRVPGSAHSSDPASAQS